MKTLRRGAPGRVQITTHLAAGALMAMLGGTTAAHADEPSEPSKVGQLGVRVLLWPDRGTPPSPALETQLMEALRTRLPAVLGSEVVITDPDLLERAARDTEDLARAEAALADARAAFLGFDFDKARSAVGSLLVTESETLSRPGQLATLVEALRLLAQVELAAGRGDAAARWALAAGTVATFAAIGVSSGPPEYAQLEAAVLARASRQPPQPLRVRSTPPGAAVEVDGRGVGVTPLVVEVLPGDHVVRLEMPGRQATMTITEVGPSGAALDQTLDPDPQDAVLARRVARGLLDPGDAPSRHALLARTGAKAVLVYRQTFDGTRLAVHRPGKEPRAFGPGEPRTLAPATADLILGVERADPVPITDSKDAPPPVYARWWFWTAVGAVAAGAAVAIAVATRPEQRAIVRPQ